MILDSFKRADGARELRKIDIFEVSLTATPMNAGTHVTSWKSTEPEPEPPSPEELRARSDALERELGLEDPLVTSMREMGRGWFTSPSRNGDDTKTLTPTQLRAKSDRIAREFAPVVVASFEC